MSVRSEARRVEVYNEGLVVYLYDPSNTSAILTTNPESVLSPGKKEYSEDKALKKLTEQGTLVLYTLQQDDPIVVDVVVGPPMSKEELKKSPTPWMKPQQTIISLPSGHLRVDTPNTFRLDADAQECAKEYEAKHGKPPADDNLEAFGLHDKCGDVQVPPGDYVLTLYRVDFDKMEDDEDPDYEGPGELIVLTPIDEAERPKKIPRVLEFGAGYARFKGLQKFSIEEGVFRGICLGGNVINMRWSHVEKLGLRRGQRLRITHDGKPYDAVFLGAIDPRTTEELFAIVYPDKLDALYKKNKDILTAALPEDKILELQLLRLQSLNPKLWLTGENGTEVVIEPQDEFLLPPPESLPSQPQGEYGEGEVHGEVLAAGPGGLELSCEAKVLRRLTRAKSTVLTLTIGGVAAPLLLLPSADHEHRPYHIVSSVKDAKRQKEFKDIFAYMYDGGDDVFRACVGEKRSKELTKLLQEYKKGCTFTPQDGYVPKDEAKAAELRKRCIALWNEGVGRLAVDSAMQAILRPHWDNPKWSTLSCRPIGHPPKHGFQAKPGDGFVLTLGEAG